MGSRNRDRMVPHRLRLSDVARLEGALFAICGECMHGGVLPLGWLLAKYGRDQVVKELERKLICRWCSERAARIDAKFPR